MSGQHLSWRSRGPSAAAIVLLALLFSGCGSFGSSGSSAKTSLSPDQAKQLDAAAQRAAAAISGYNAAFHNCPGGNLSLAELEATPGGPLRFGQCLNKAFHALGVKPALTAYANAMHAAQSDVSGDCGLKLEAAHTSLTAWATVLDQDHQHQTVGASAKTIIHDNKLGVALSHKFTSAITAAIAACK